MRHPAKLAFPDAGRWFRVVVVTEQRARWKEIHDHPTEKMIRCMRFIWMRHPFSWKDRTKLHGGVLGALLRGGYVERDRDMLAVTRKGGDVLNNNDRRR
jgi:hypothetical protein